VIKTYRTTSLYHLITSSHKKISLEKINKVLNKFLGKQKQLPPMFSAKKIKGKKLYDLARRGITIKRKKNKIEIYKLEILDFDPESYVLRLKAEVSSGTYIRVLANDIGKKLGCGAYCEELERTKLLRPGLEIIKSLVVAENNYPELERTVDTLSAFVDAFITDTFDPATGAEGATGKTHDWNISRKLVEISPKPVIIAGGLNHTNVKQAILEIHPAGVDAHTGVESKDGRKNYDMVKKFVNESKEGFTLINS